MTAASILYTSAETTTSRPMPATHLEQTWFERRATATAFVVFSVLFVSAQFLHSNPLAGLEPMTGTSYLDAFHGHMQVHVAHLLEFICGALLIVMASQLYGLTRARFPHWAFAALMMGATGAIMLIGNKAAICLSASALDTLPEPQLLAMVPGLDVLLQRQGFLSVLWLLPLLPIGFAVFGALVWRAGLMPRWQAVCLFFGSLLLVNPGVQLMNTFGAILLAFAVVPYGLQLALSRR